MTYWTASIKEVINSSPFLNITEYNVERIDNEMTLLPSLLKMFLMFQMRFWYDKEPDDQNYVNIMRIIRFNILSFRW